MKLLKKIKGRLPIAIILGTSLSTVTAYAVTPTTLEFNFDSAQMFGWTNSLLDAMMPILYITLGIALAFIIINALKYAFR